jgi:hypothetical protein
MNQDSHMLMATKQETSDVGKGKLDIIVLRYMVDHMEMQLQKTKYYTFQAGQQRPLIRELLNELPCHMIE